MIKISIEMKEAHAAKLAEVEARVDRQIKEAVVNGNISAYFACDKDSDADVYDEIRAKYESAGYHIRPTGYIGGVYQKTEHIHW